MRGEFAGFYEREAPLLVRSLALAIGDAALAEDVAAEAFARAWSRWADVRHHDRPVAWVMRVALNLANDRFRHRRVERRAAPAIARPDIGEDPEPQVDLRLWDAVRELPETERHLVALRYVADLTQAEIAGLLGIPAGTVASGLNRARQRLGVALGPTHEEELA